MHPEQAMQEMIRERDNPNWREQRRMHFKILHISGPSKMQAKDQIRRAMELDGYSYKKKRGFKFK